MSQIQSFKTFTLVYYQLPAYLLVGLNGTQIPITTNMVRASAMPLPLKSIKREA